MLERIVTSLPGPRGCAASTRRTLRRNDNHTGHFSTARSSSKAVFAGTSRSALWYSDPAERSPGPMATIDRRSSTPRCSGPLGLLPQYTARTRGTGELDQRRNAYWKRPLIDAELRTVPRVDDPLAFIADPETHERTRCAFRKVREIFAAHCCGRTLDANPGVRVPQLYRERFRHRNVVVNGRIHVEDFELRFAVIRRCYALDDTARTRFELLAHCLILRAERAGHLHAVGNNVIAIAAVDRSDRNHDRREWIRFARRDILQRQDRRCSVTTNAGDRYVKFVGRSIHDTRRHADDADIETIVDVQHRDRLDFRILHDARLDHRQRAARPFFRRLKQQHDGSLELVARSHQLARGTQEHRGVRIMPTRVHLAGDFR